MDACGNGMREGSQSPGPAQEAVPRTGSQGGAESHFPVYGMQGASTHAYALPNL